MHIYRPKGLEKASELLAKSTKLLVYYDPDPDGLFSGYLVANVLKRYNRPYIYYINENRQHGMTLDDVQLSKLEGYTVIAVDFSISKETLDKMADYDISVINIDHHAISHQELLCAEKYVVINNQYSFEPEEWRFLSGAGVVYYSLATLFPAWGEDERYRALVGITLLSDIRAIENQRAYELLKTTYNWKDNYSNYLISIAQYGATSYQFGVQRYLDRNFIDYQLSPRLNALFRLNLGDVAVNIIEGAPCDLTEFNRRFGLPVDNTTVNLTFVVKYAKEVQTRLEEQLQIIKYPNLVVGYIAEDAITTTGYSISNFVGLVAGRLKEKEGTTAIVFVQNENGIVRGSLRGIYDGVDYLNTCRNNGVECDGHLGAFGIKKCDNVDFNVLSSEFERIEKVRPTKENNIIYVDNFSNYVRTDLETPEYNAYTRDSHRKYYKYIGGNFSEVHRSSNYVQYDIDGVTVKCFDPDVSPQTGYILPLLNNGYIEYILKKVTI